MVKIRLLLLALVVLFSMSICLGTTKAWTGAYSINKEWVKIWINQDGTIDLFYNISVALYSGENINYVLVGQPQSDFTIGEAMDQYGHKLVTSPVRQGTDYKVKVLMDMPLRTGDAIWLTLMTNVAQMIYNDTQNPGNIGMQFIPTWWPVTVQDLRVSIALPPNVTASMVKTSINWNNTFFEDGRLSIYWQKANLSPDQRYPVGVSFPKECLPNYTPSDTSQNPPDGSAPPTIYPTLTQYAIVALFIGVFVIVIAAGAGAALGKKRYFPARISMETLGIKHGLTAVEASYLLDMKPTKIVTEMLYSLLKKRAVWVEGTKPSIRMRIMPDFRNKSGTTETPLRYYEIDFLDAIEKDGTLDEAKLARTVMALRDNVEEKMRGYCRRDTMDYYKSIVAKAWKQVEQAGTPELASNTYDEQLLWLLLDPNVNSNTQTIFRDRIFAPNPMWFWYWYGYHNYHPNPTYMPNIETPLQSAKPPTIPGADFANNIATSLEGTANNIVLNLEKFADSIVPAPQSRSEVSHEPAHHGAACVCACHACACACACVSCACACAGGGVG